MEIQYQRNHKNSYMVLLDNSIELSMDASLAEHMMKAGKIEGLLSFVTMEHGEKMTYWYTITGCQSVRDWLKFHKLNGEFIRKIMLSLMAVLDRLSNYYFRPEHIYLELDQIFMDQSGERFFFTYAPMIEHAISDEITRLLEQFLPLIDHKDTEAVKLGYGLYEKSREENVNIWECLEKESNLQGSTLNNYKILDTWQKTKGLSEEFKLESSINDKEALGNTTNRERISDLSKKDTKDKIKPSNSRDFFESEDEKLSFSDFLPKGFFKKKEVPAEIEPLVIEPETVEPETIKPTELVPEKGIILGKLKYDGAGNQEDMPIDTDEFLIGCRNPKANGQILAPSVSRNHARIIREGDAYFLEDLNSRNGTFVNDKQLQYKQRVRLMVGDRVRFSSEEYRFY